MDASSIVLASVVKTFVDVFLATFSLEALVTNALEIAGQVDAFAGSNATRFRSTIIEINLTTFAYEARLATIAFVTIDEIVTSAIVLARIWLALVNVELAVFALPTRLTLTCVGRAMVDTLC